MNFEKCSFWTQLATLNAHDPHDKHARNTHNISSPIFLIAIKPATTTTPSWEQQNNAQRASNRFWIDFFDFFYDVQYSCCFDLRDPSGILGGTLRWRRAFWSEVLQGRRRKLVLKTVIFDCFEKCRLWPRFIFFCLDKWMCKWKVINTVLFYCRILFFHDTQNWLSRI